MIASASRQVAKSLSVQKPLRGTCINIPTEIGSVKQRELKALGILAYAIPLLCMRIEPIAK